MRAVTFSEPGVSSLTFLAMVRRRWRGVPGLFSKRIAGATQPIVVSSRAHKPQTSSATGGVVMTGVAAIKSSVCY